MDKFLSSLEKDDMIITGDKEGYINFSGKLTIDEFVKAAKESGLGTHVLFKDDEMGVVEMEAKGRGLSIGAVFTLDGESGVLVTNYCYFKRNSFH